MKLVSTAIMITFASLSLHASPTKPAEFKFVFNQEKKTSFSITKSASTKEAAFKLAAKDCFQKLTGGKYPGEDRGLDIIDICANPKM